MALPAVVALSACRTQQAGFSGYAFIANQEGGAVAAVSMGVMAVVKHIPVEGAPMQVLAAQATPAVYVLTPDTERVHQIETTTLKVARTVRIPARPDAMYLAADEDRLYVLSREAQSLYAVALNDETGEMRVAWRLRFPEPPTDFALSPDGETAAVTSPSSIRLVSLAVRSLGTPLGRGNFGEVHYLQGGERLVAADLDREQISVYRTLNPQLVAHLPVGVRPANLCFNQDGGQLFVTGPERDAVAILYPYDVPEVAKTVVVGHAPEAMTASRNLLFITSPSTGDVSVFHVGMHKMIGVVPVGHRPSAVAITPDDRLALVLKQESGEVAVLDIDAMQPNRYKSAALVTVIPVGSRPVSAAMHA